MPSAPPPSADPPSPAGPPAGPPGGPLGRSLGRFLGPDGWRRLVLFVLVGGASALVEFGVFMALAALGLVAWAASAISFVSSFAVNYRGNRDLTFRAGAVPGAIRRYITLVAVNLVASTALVAALTWCDVPGWIAKLIAMALVGLVNFVVLRVWVFRPSG